MADVMPGVWDLTEDGDAAVTLGLIDDAVVALGLAAGEATTLPSFLDLPATLWDLATEDWLLDDWQCICMHSR